MKPLFQQQCEALVKTLTEAKANESNALYMNTWVKYNHSCGTAACICGYQALSNNLNLFKKATEWSKDLDTQYFETSSDIAYDLDASCKELFGDEYLACSIFASRAFRRFISARHAEVADEKKLRTFKHLTSENTSLEDAIKYIEFVIEKCKEQSA